MHQFSKKIYEHLLTQNVYDLNEAMRELERCIILRALATSYTVTEAAEKLLINRTTLVEKCRSMDIKSRDILVPKYKK